MRLVIIGGSDAGISAGPAAHELARETEVTLLVTQAWTGATRRPLAS
jgi:hypothetical protein